MMSRLLTVPRFYGPLFTVAFTIVYHLAAGYFGFTITYGWLWLALIVGVFIAGLRAGLLCAIWVTLYALYTIPNDPSRVFQIFLISVAGAYLVGYLRQRERLLQRAMYMTYANGNVTKVRDALTIATAGKSLSKEPGIIAAFEQIESDLGNSLAVIDGYRQMRKEIEYVNEWYARPGNAAKLQRMREAGE